MGTEEQIRVDGRELTLLVWGGRVRAIAEHVGGEYVLVPSTDSAWAAASMPWLEEPETRPDAD